MSIWLGILDAEPAVPPDPPTNLSGSPRYRGVQLAWNPPINTGGVPITDYVIQQWTSSATWTTISDGVSTASSYAVTGLTDSWWGSFRVAAVNIVGQSDWSASVNTQSLWPSVVTIGGSVTYVPATGRWVHTFTTSTGGIQAITNMSVDVLVVNGGVSGENSRAPLPQYAGAGGKGGNLRQYSGLFLLGAPAPQPQLLTYYPVTVGGLGGQSFFGPTTFAGAFPPSVGAPEIPGVAHGGPIPGGAAGGARRTSTGAGFPGTAGTPVSANGTATVYGSGGGGGGFSFSFTNPGIFGGTAGTGGGDGGPGNTFYTIFRPPPFGGPFPSPVAAAAGSAATNYGAGGGGGGLGRPSNLTGGAGRPGVVIVTY